MPERISAVVRGTVNFPDHPEHVGANGLQGGEDIHTSRDTFRSVGEAMTWARKILDEVTAPRRWDGYGTLLTPHTDPAWTNAVVYYENPAEEHFEAWSTNHGTRDWVEGEDDYRQGATVARTD